MRYAIVMENARAIYSAHLPGLPGCMVTGTTIGECEQQIREAIECHLDGLREVGLAAPEPASLAEYVEIAA